MDPQTAIHGWNDDCIIIDGEVNKQLYANYDGATYVRVGKWKFKVNFDMDGIWRANVVDQPDGLGCQHFDPGECEGYRDYTEVVKFNAEGTTIEKVDEDEVVEADYGRKHCPKCGTETEFVQFATGDEDTVETTPEEVGEGILELRTCDNCKLGIENILTLDERTTVEV